VVTLVPGERHQTLVGFGGSIAWYQNKLVPTPPDGIYPDWISIENEPSFIPPSWVNSGDQTADVRIDTAAGVTAGGAGSAVYRTVYRPPGKSETWKELGPLLPTGVVERPGRSIATVVWSVAKKS
jgi:hypothetical protein